MVKNLFIICNLQFFSELLKHISWKHHFLKT